MSLSNDYNDSIIGKKRKGTVDDPFKSYTITLPVINSKTVLPEIPNRFEKVQVTGAGLTMYEVEDGELTENIFKVDYTNGVVFFNSTHNNKDLTFSFQGEGQHYIPSSSIWITNDTNGIQTAKEKLDEVDTEITEQKSRVDNLIVSTPQPSEITDMRVDKNGKVFSIAKDRIDNEQQKIEIAYKDLNGKTHSSLKVRIDAEQKKIEDAYFAKNGTSYVSLKERFDKTDDKLGDINQLTTTDKTDLVKAINENTIQKVTKGKVVGADFDISSDDKKIKLINLADEVQQALTGNAPALSVIENGSVVRTKIPDKAVSRGKTSFFKTATQNVVNKKAMVTGGFYSPSNGGFTTDATYVTTEEISVVSGEVYRSNTISVAFYNNKYVFISGIASSTLTANFGVFTVPVNAVYMRVNFSASLNFPICTKNNHNYLESFEEVKYQDEDILIKTNNVDKNNFLLSARNLDVFTSERTENLFDPSNVVLGRYNNLGEYSYNPTTPTVTSNFIEVLEGDKLITKSSGYVTFYDSNKNFVSGLTPTTYFTVPAGVAYVRTTTFLSTMHEEMVVKGTVLPSTFVPYYKHTLKSQYIDNVSLSSSSKLANKKWNTLGDSITEAAWGGVTKYDAIISNKYGMSLVNYGEGGTRIAYTADRTRAFVERYQEMRDDADIITVFGGTNDYSANVPLGTITSTDNSTFYGALNILCTGLINKYVGKSIGFITPIQRRGYDVTKMMQYVNAIKEVCAKYSIPVLDLTTAGMLSPDIDAVNTQLYSDGVHLNNAGQEVIARRIESFIESIA
jgi:lysophospholipase L1-like esterase